MVLPLDHYLANYTCGPQGDAGPPPRGQEDREEEGEARLELCQGASPITFLHFDKNFVQLCLAAEPEAAPRLLAPDALEFRFVEVLLINNNNSSQFTCGVLCRWFEECLRLGERGARRCSLTQAGCSCQAEVPPVPRQNETLSNALPSADAPAATSSSQCCVTELHSGNANDLYASEIKYADFPSVSAVLRPASHHLADVSSQSRPSSLS
ncbi:adhesion G protein-coupled receptor B2-like [Gopherus evgoodei]|uniref:adhesion G protein-coupled receptor B2-like n=1 Tax=Gopherus evgoodei TaxID=1825980 RepID=UPI0011CEDDE8|nr:adhesion G protein-coupled receptor B2-like [Gopherus evgoodei]